MRVGNEGCGLGAPGTDTEMYVFGSVDRFSDYGLADSWLNDGSPTLMSSRQREGNMTEHELRVSEVLAPAPDPFDK